MPVLMRSTHEPTRPGAGSLNPDAPPGELIVPDSNLRACDGARQTLNMKWLNALGGTSDRSEFIVVEGYRSGEKLIDN